MISSLSIHQLRPFSANKGAESDSTRRYSRAILTGMTSLLSKLIVLATTLICVPLTYRYLGADRYGLWMTVTSLVLFLGFADFGLGNGLASAIAEANGRDDKAFARQQVSCAFFLLLGVAISILAILACAYSHINWSHLYHTQTNQGSLEAGPATAVLIICTALNMPLGTVLRVQVGYQQGYIADLWNTVGNILALFAVVAAVKSGAGLPWLVAGLAGSPLIATTLNWVVQFCFRTPWLLPKPSLVEARSMLRLARMGGLFFIQQCCGLVYYVSDNLVIAQTLDSTHVAQFAVLQRLFSLGLISQYFMTPLWPAFGEALVRLDFTWARLTIRRAIVSNFLVGGVSAIALLCGSQFIVRRWTGLEIGPIDPLRVGFALWIVLVGYVAAMNSFLNQRGVMARHLVFFGGASFLSLALKLYLVRHWSLAGVVWATLIAFSLVYVLPAWRLAFGYVAMRARQARPQECLSCC